MFPLPPKSPYPSEQLSERNRVRVTALQCAEDAEIKIGSTQLLSDSLSYKVTYGAVLDR